MAFLVDLVIAVFAVSSRTTKRQSVCVSVCVFDKILLHVCTR